MLHKLKSFIGFGRKQTDSYIDTPDSPGFVFILGKLALRLGKCDYVDPTYEEHYSFAILFFYRAYDLYTTTIRFKGIVYSPEFGWEIG